MKIKISLKLECGISGMQATRFIKIRGRNWKSAHRDGRGLVEQDSECFDGDLPQLLQTIRGLFLYHPL